MWIIAQCELSTSLWSHCPVFGRFVIITNGTESRRILKTGYPGDSQCYTVPLKGLGHTTESLVKLYSLASFQATVQRINKNVYEALLGLLSIFYMSSFSVNLVVVIVITHVIHQLK